MKTKEELKVFIIDDDDAVRDALQELVESIARPTEVFSSARDFLAQYSPERGGCLILDIRMPGMSGLELQAVLNKKQIDLPIIFITGHGDVPMAVEAMQHGAFDFLQKPFRDQELLDRIERALEQFMQRCQNQMEKRQILERIGQLTAREQEVMERVVVGKANKVIAFELNISQRTVEIHRARAMEKMGADTLAELVRMIMLIRE